MNSIAGKNILSLNELTKEEILKILDIANILKNKKNNNVFPQVLKNKVLGMLFQKPSTRTRISFEVGMFQLGGHAIDLSFADSQISRGESLQDTGKILSKYVDVLMARVYNHQDLLNLSTDSNIPLINGLSDSYHPCQTLADLFTIQEKKNIFPELKVAYVGDGNNVANSLIIGCSKIGIDISVITPLKYKPNPEAINLAIKNSKITGSDLIFTDDINGVSNADVIYTDVWMSMGFENEGDNRINTFKSKYQINKAVMKKANLDAIFMHCMPIKRGFEVTSEVVDSSQSVIWEQAENRLHTQNALLCLLLNENLNL